MDRRRKIAILTGIYLGVIWLVSSLPLLALWLEFRGIQFCHSSSLALFIATYYGSYFLFFAAFGWLAAIALFFPLATGMTVLLEHRRVFYAAIGLYILTTTAVALVEFFGSAGAIFSVAPDILENHPSGRQFLTDFKTICNPNNKLDYATFQTNLQGLILLGRSYSDVLYYFSFVAQALFLIAVFAVFIVAIIYRDRMKTLAPRRLRDTIFFLLGYAIFAVSMWCLLRISYRMDSEAIFGANNPLFGDYLVMALYAVVLAVYVLYFEFAFEKLAKIMTSIGGFLTFVFGVTLVQKGMASQIIGIRATVFNLIAVILLFLLISLILLAFMLRPSPDEPDS